MTNLSFQPGQVDPEDQSDQFNVPSGLDKSFGRQDDTGDEGRLGGSADTSTTVDPYFGDDEDVTIDQQTEYRSRNEADDHQANDDR
jgi:hypothetical protein